MAVTKITADFIDADAVETTQIKDANVTTGKIADNAITLAKMAGGTDGEIITYDSSGDPAYVGVGTANQALTSNGVGAAPTMQNAGLHLIETQTASSSAQLDFQTGIDSTFDQYEFRISDLVPATDDVELRMRVFVSSTIVDGASTYSCKLQRNTSAGVDTVTADHIVLCDDAVTQSLGSDTGESYSGVVRMFNPASAALYTKFTVAAIYDPGAGIGNLAHVLGGGRYDGSVSAVDGIRFYMESGNIESGKISLYGVKI